jgi:predicted metalloprotease
MLHLTSAKHVRKKIIWLAFDNGVRGESDLSESLIGPIFEPLNDDVEFAKFTFDSELKTIVWPNGADFAPEYLHELLTEQSNNSKSA